MRRLIEAGRLRCCHDVSDGGLIVAVAEMVIAGGLGADITGAVDPGRLFGEDQGRYVLALDRKDTEAVLAEAAAAGVAAETNGGSGGASLTVNGVNAISVGELRAAHARWLPAYMAGT